MPKMPSPSSIPPAMEYDQKQGEMFEPPKTLWIARLVNVHGLQYTLDHMPGFLYPLAAEVGSPHTQQCVEQQRAALWTLIARRVQSELDAKKSNDRTQMLYIWSERYRCFCGGEEYTLMPKGVLRDLRGNGGEYEVWMGWKRIVQSKEEGPDAACEKMMAELSLSEKAGEET